jgi:ABC-type sugar transport system ATPase subunit
MSGATSLSQARQPKADFALAVSNVRKSFGSVRAVIDASLTVATGQAVAVMGANGAGKSTLMNMLGGLIQPDGGTINLGGSELRLTGPADAIAAGIAFVQQELSVFPTMTVAENICIGDFPMRNGRIDKTAMNAEAAHLLDSLGTKLRPESAVVNLSTGEKQMIEIARAMRRKPKVLIFDEPTSSLANAEKARLFEMIRGLKDQGVAVLYITHFIGEIFEVCDRVMVMREGRTVADRPIAEVTKGEVVNLMLGEIGAQDRMVAANHSAGPPVLRVSGLSSPNRIDDASFTLHAGEIVGLWGLLGSGRTELARGLLGLDGPVSGKIEIADSGRMVPILPVNLRKHTAFVTEDRRGEGLLLPFSVAENIALPNLADVSAGYWFVSRSRIRALANRLIEQLAIKVSGPAQKVGTLSGGNQQKVVFGKWLASKPRILILDEPTRGLDLAAKGDILRLTTELAAAGATVLLISSELEELMRVCHRYLVVSERRVVAEFGANAIERDLIDALSWPATAKEQ